MEGLSSSRFNMWRAVVAIIHADSVVQPHEVNFVLESIQDLPLSVQQRRTLEADIETVGDIASFFAQIITPRDKEDFFHLARAAAWSDGDFNAHEQSLLHRLKFSVMAEGDKKVMAAAQRSFHEIYLEGHEDEVDDPAMVRLIKNLMNRKAA